MNETTDQQAEEEIRVRYTAVDTANVADVLDTLDLPNQGLSPDFTPYPADAGKLAGWAFTISGEMASSAREGGDPQKMQACSELRPGSVSVWSGTGKGVCFFGELIAIGMRECGAVGALVDGGVRDVAWLAALTFPVYARYRTPIQSIGRWRVTGWGVPVSLPGATTNSVQVKPGDFILADEDGAIVIPAGRVEEVLAGAEDMGRREKRIRAELATGVSLADALERFGHV